MWLAGRNLQMFHTGLYVAYIRLVRNGTFLHTFVPTIQNVIFLFIQYMMIPNVSVRRLTSWMTLEFHFFVNLEVLYMFRKIPTSLWSLVNVWNFLRYVYNFWFQPSLYRNNVSVQCAWLELYIYCHPGNYILWTFITLIS